MNIVASSGEDADSNQLNTPRLRKNYSTVLKLRLSQCLLDGYTPRETCLSYISASKSCTLDLQGSICTGWY